MNNTDNFIFVVTQNSISTNINSGNTTASAVNFQYKFNGNTYTSPVEILQRQGFSDATKGIAYSFSILNTPVGTFSLDVDARKRATNGTSETVYFNGSRSGSIVVFVYEK